MLTGLNCAFRNAKTLPILPECSYFVILIYAFLSVSGLLSVAKRAV